MGRYIQVDKDLPLDPRMVELGEAALTWLGRKLKLTDAQLSDPELAEFARNAVMGGMVRLWMHGDTYIESDDRLKLASRTILTVTGFARDVLRAITPKWLLKLDENDSYELPNYSSKNHILDKEHRRALSAKRSREYRARQREESSRSSRRDGRDGPPSDGRDTSVTTGPDPDPGPGTVPSGPVPDPKEQRAARRVITPEGAAPAPRAKAPNPVPWQPPAKGSTWQSWSAPPTPRTGSFENDFKKRFGATPDEASRQRAEAEAKEKPKRQAPPKAPDEEIPR